MLDNIVLGFIMLFAFIGFVCTARYISQGFLLFRISKVMASIIGRISLLTMKRKLRSKTDDEDNPLMMDRMTRISREMADVIRGVIPEDKGKVEVIDFKSFISIFIFRKEDVVEIKTPHPGVDLVTAGYDVAVRIELVGGQLMISVKLPEVDWVVFKEEVRAGATSMILEYLSGSEKKA